MIAVVAGLANFINLNEKNNILIIRVLGLIKINNLFFEFLNMQDVLLILLMHFLYF